MTESPLLRIDEAPELFADALLVDAYDKLLFISLWGRDTAIQEFLARITLSQDDDGLQSFNLLLDGRDGQRRKRVLVGDTKRLDHTTGRMPSQNVFGDMAQLWLFDRLITEPDLSNRRTIALFRGDEPASVSGTALDQERIWPVMKSLCHLPLLDHWSGTVIDTFQQQEWINALHGIGVHGALIDLSLGQEVEAEISRLIREGVLTLH